MYRLALFSLFLSFSIDHCSSDPKTYSLVLLVKTEPERASAPPTKKETPVSSSAILEKKPEEARPAKVEPDKTRMANNKALTAQIIKFPFKTQTKSIRQAESVISLKFIVTHSFIFLSNSRSIIRLFISDCEL